MSLTTNIVAYWKLDESTGNPADATGNGNGLTNSGGTYAAALINNGLDLGSGNDVLNSGNYTYINSAMGIASGGDFSISLWFKRHQEITSSPGSVFFLSRRINGNGGLYQVQYNYNGGVENIGWNDGGAVGSHTVTLGTTWHHLVVARASSSSTIYLDGSSIGTQATGTTSESSNYLQIGCAGTQYFNAAIFDEIGVWSRGLSSTEVTKLYNSGAGLQYPFPTVSTGSFLTAML